MSSYVGGDSYTRGMILMLSGYALLTILNILTETQHLVDEYDYEARSVVHDEPDHGIHYDLSFYVYLAGSNEIRTYYIDIANNLIYISDDMGRPISFQESFDLASWMANESQDIAYQAAATQGYYRSILMDGIHQDTSKEAQVRQQIIDVINQLPVDSMLMLVNDSLTTDTSKTYTNESQTN